VYTVYICVRFQELAQLGTSISELNQSFAVAEQHLCYHLRFHFYDSELALLEIHRLLRHTCFAEDCGI